MTTTTQPQSKEIFRNIWTLSFPTMIGYALQSVYDMVDMVWVGRISSGAVAGITIFSLIFWIGTVLNEILNASGISMISQSYGKGDREKTRTLIEQSITGKVLISFVAGAIILLILNFTLGHFSTDPVVVTSAYDYGIIRLLFIPFLFASYSVNTALRSIGHARSPMVLMLIASVLNLFLDPILMFDTIPFTTIPGFGMGVKGAAIATVISTIVAFLIGLVLLTRSGCHVSIRIRGLFRFDPKIFTQSLQVGLPAGAENLFRNLLSLLLIRVVAQYGTNAITTAGIGTRLFGFAYVPIYGSFMAGSTLIAQYLGAEKPEFCRKVARYSALTSLVGTAVLCLFAGLFPSGLMSVFIKDAAVIQMGVPMIRMLIPALLLGSISMGFASAFIGSGYNRPFLIASVVARWVVQFPFLLFATQLMKWPLESVWLSFTIAGIFDLMMILIPYKRGKWLLTRV